MAKNEAIIRPVIERDAAHGGPIFWDTDHEGKLWLGVEVWLTLEDAVEWFDSMSAEHWLAEFGLGKGSLFGRMEIGQPSAYLEAPVERDPKSPEFGKAGEVMVYGEETCERCGTHDPEDRVRYSATRTLCESCEALESHEEDVAQERAHGIL